MQLIKASLLLPMAMMLAIPAVAIAEKDPPKQKSPRDFGKRLFARLDQNDDKKITEEEIPEKAPQRLKALLKKADRNDDKVLEPNELAAAAAKVKDGVNKRITTRKDRPGMHRGPWGPHWSNKAVAMRHQAMKARARHGKSMPSNHFGRGGPFAPDFGPTRGFGPPMHRGRGMGSCPLCGSSWSMGMGHRGGPPMAAKWWMMQRGNPFAASRSPRDFAPPGPHAPRMRGRDHWNRYGHPYQNPRREMRGCPQVDGGECPRMGETPGPWVNNNDGRATPPPFEPKGPRGRMQGRRPGPEGGPPMERGPGMGRGPGADGPPMGRGPGMGRGLRGPMMDEPILPPKKEQRVDEKNEVVKEKEKEEKSSEKDTAEKKKEKKEEE
jgi:hypothetical protein